ncbi:MAG: hypothetical protein MR729_06825 [Dorea sp.]|nr:hypothetical protein [Dorea sp.]
MAYNKIIYGGKTLIDLTGDTVTADKLLKGVTAHDMSGESITGTCNYDSDTSGATAVVAEILAGKTAFVRGSKITGTMPNNGSVKKNITKKTEVVNIAQGYHDGSGSIGIDSVEQEKLIATNIRSGITILGVTGSMSGTEDVTAQSRSVTPRTTEQTITPETGFNYLSSVTVAAIPYTESENTAGGITVTIGG